MSRTKNSLAVSLVAAALSLTAACSSSSSGGTSPTSLPPSSDPAASSVADTPSVTDTDTAPPVASDPPAAATTSGTFELQSSSGITVDGTIDLHTPVSAGAAANAWNSEGGNGTLPCVTDTQTDGVMIGTLAFANKTPSYTPDFYVNFNGITTGGSMALGIGYSDGNQCVTDGQDAYEGSAIQPNWTGSSWGPVPIDIVIHNDIGPSYPNGNPANLGPVTLVANSQSGDDYGLESEGGIINQLNGPVMQVHLEQVKD